MPPVTIAGKNGRQIVPTLVDHNGRPIRSERDYDLPHMYTSQSLIYGGWYTYLHEIYDEAMRNNRENALAMGRDVHLMRCLFERVRAVTSLKFHLDVDDDTDHWQVAVRDGITQSLNQTPYLRRLFKSFMWAVWSGRGGNNCLWEWAKATVDGPNGRDEHKVLKLAAHLPINGDKIGYRLDHTPYVQVYGGADEKDIPGAEFTYTTDSKAMLVQGTWRDRILIHKHNVMDADFRESERMDMIHGVGVRSYLYWSWWLRQEYLTAVIKSLDRFGLGFAVIKFPSGNAQAEQEAIRAGQSLSRDRSVLVVPVVEGTGGETSGVEIVDTPVAGVNAMLQLQQACKDEEERFIIGQTASSKSDAQGMGTHDNSFQMETKSQITEEDAYELGETLTGSEREPGLIHIIKTKSYPWADFPVRLVLDVRPPDVESKLAAATMLFNMNVPLDTDEIRGIAGLTKPDSGEDVTQNPAAQQVGPDGQPIQPGQEQPGQEGQPVPDVESEGEAVQSGDPIFDELLQEGTRGGGKESYSRQPIEQNRTAPFAPLPPEPEPPPQETMGMALVSSLIGLASRLGQPQAAPIIHVAAPTMPAVHVGQPTVTVNPYINVNPTPVNVAAPSVQVDAPVTVQVPEQAAAIPPAVHVHATVTPPNVTVEPVQVTVQIPEQKPMKRTVVRDAEGNITGTVEEPE